MFKKDRPARDPFTFSLGGIPAVSSFAILPVIADDRIRQIRDRQAEEAQPNHDQSAHCWEGDQSHVAQANCV